MSKTILKIKHLFKVKKVVLSLILFLTLILSIWGIKVGLAYYNSTLDFSLLGTVIGDFNTGDGDINVMVYAENDAGRYNLIKSIPSVGYVLNTEKTDCTADYTLDGANLVLNATEKTTCKFYFDKEMEADIKTFIMLESDKGTYTYENANYKLAEFVDYGYEYLTYNCDDNSTITNFSYNETSREITIKTTNKNVCYVYFKKILEVNIYIEQEGSDTYLNVQTIPGNYEYVKSSTKTSYCEDSSGNQLNATITYENSDLYVDADGEGTCYVFLDLK